MGVKRLGLGVEKQLFKRFTIDFEIEGVFVLNHEKRLTLDNEVPPESLSKSSAIKEKLT